jgi:hypothetical protein
MDILHYTVDLKYLFDTQDQQVIVNNTAKEKKAEEFIENKKELLKYVLPLMHGIYALHNRKCTKSDYSVTGDKGLLGLDKVNIEEKLKFIVESDYYFKDNGESFACNLSYPLRGPIKVWLNKDNNFKATPDLAYSMSTLVSGDNGVYGKSIEDELLKVAKVCAQYTDEWK